MNYYPLFLSLAGKDVLVAGAGEVGLRKVTSLLAAAPARLVLVSPELSQDASAALVERLASQGVECLPRSFLPEDLDDKTLVFAATGNREVNAQISELCARRSILCNVADAPLEGSFIVPSHFSDGGITVAFSTGGASPALAKRLRMELESFIGRHYAPLLTLIGRLRPKLLRMGLPQEENAAVFCNLLESDLGVLLERQDIAGATAVLDRILPRELHDMIGDLLHEL